MRFFWGSSTHKIDAKGRVSIPADYRRVLEKEEPLTVVLIPSLRGEPAIEGMSRRRFEKLAAWLSKMGPLNKRARALAHKVIAPARFIELENTGRIVLGADLRRAAGLTDAAHFVGLTGTFQIWNPDTYAAHYKDFEEEADEALDDLPWVDEEEDA